MRTRFLLIQLLLLCCGACSSLNRADFFDFGVNEVKDVPICDSLFPKLMSQIGFEDLTAFQILDSLIVYEKGRNFSENCFLVRNMMDGSLRAEFGRIGRGAEEMLSSTVNFEMADGVVYAYDYYAGNYFEFDVRESILRSRSVCRRKVELEHMAGKSMLCAHLLPESKLLLFDSSSRLWTPGLNQQPCFSVYDLENGSHLNDYHLFKNVPLANTSRLKILPQQVLAFQDCMSADRETVCFANNSISQINFLNVKTGDAFGVRLKIKGLSPFSPAQSVFHFMSVAGSEDRVYALYLGVPPEKVEDTKPILYVFDWDGNIMGKYQMDQPYAQCRVANGRLYLNKISDWTSYIYYLDLATLN